MSRLEFIHSMGLIHRDVKPENFLTALKQNSALIYMVDFGLAKHYRDPHSGFHIPFRSGKTLTGTARYASLNTHLGYEQSRRDDVEMMVYTMVYFLNGGLPWQRVGGVDKKEKYEKIMLLKKYTSVNVLCRGHYGIFDIIVEIGLMLKYAKELDFCQKPNYAHLKHLLKTAFTAAEFEYDFKFDWLDPTIVESHPNIFVTGNTLNNL
eukprot:TRINITY_DN6241_c0_g1_i2.p1 TRINITY_DN6241_c0_g1~~TRINITY_DN6241_c0_g1_i2.p1  ORF type:complete len:207 (-),score=41.31 TRINITY_DN6241_c0_g1_i2:331-951(-)